MPALPVFGAKPLSRATEVAVGRTATHLVVATGPWAVWLPMDAKAKFEEGSVEYRSTRARVADLPDELAARVREVSLAAFRA